MQKLDCTVDYWNPADLMEGEVRDGKPIGFFKDLVDLKTDWVAGTVYWSEKRSMVRSWGSCSSSDCA